MVEQAEKGERSRKAELESLKPCLTTISVSTRRRSGWGWILNAKVYCSKVENIPRFDLILELMFAFREIMSRRENSQKWQLWKISSVANDALKEVGLVEIMKFQRCKVATQFFINHKTFVLVMTHKMTHVIRRPWVANWEQIQWQKKLLAESRNFTRFWESIAKFLNLQDQLKDFVRIVGSSSSTLKSTFIEISIVSFPNESLQTLIWIYIKRRPTCTVVQPPCSPQANLCPPHQVQYFRSNLRLWFADKMKLDNWMRSAKPLRPTWDRLRAINRAASSTQKL